MNLERLWWEILGLRVGSLGELEETMASRQPGSSGSNEIFLTQTSPMPHCTWEDRQYLVIWMSLLGFQKAMPEDKSSFNTDYFQKWQQEPQLEKGRAPKVRLRWRTCQAKVFSNVNTGLKTWWLPERCLPQEGFWTCHLFHCSLCKWML